MIKISEKIALWRRLLGYLLVLLLLVPGYIFSIKFVQLGIPDWGKRILGLSDGTVAAAMFGLGMAGCVGSLVGAFVFDKYNPPMRWKIFISMLSTVYISILLMITDLVKDVAGFYLWVIGLGAVVGFTGPIVYSYIYYLVEPKNRLIFSGVLVGLIYFIGASSPEEWTFENFRGDPLSQMILSVIVLGLFIIFNPLPEKVGDFGDEPYYKFSYRSTVIILVIILFIDSFGFLRVIDDPTIISQTWQGPQAFRFYIATVHIIAAIGFGYFAKRFGADRLFVISLGLFAISDSIMAIGYNSFAVIVIYCLLYPSAVSVYTVAVFGVIPDISTDKNVIRNIGIGLALYGWLMSFIATGLAFLLITAGVPFYVHLGAAAVISGVGYGILFYFTARGSFPNRYEDAEKNTDGGEN